MKQTFTIPTTFDPSRSLLSLLLTRWFGDRRRADSVRIVTLVLVPVLVGLLCYYADVFSWNGQLGVVSSEWMFAGFVLFVAVLLSLGITGRSRQAVISVEGDRIEIQSSGHGAAAGSVLLETSQIESVETISLRQYHEHYSRYRDVLKFGRAGSGASLLLITTSSRQIVLAMPRSVYLDVEPILRRLTSSDLIAA